MLCPTQWNSEFLMVQRIILLLKESVNLDVAAVGEIDNLTTSESNIAEWSHELNAEFSLQEHQIALSQTRRQKTPGEDRVAYEFLKFQPFSGERTILALFNIVWASGKRPRGWWHAIVTPILKVSKDLQLASSFRPSVKNHHCVN